LIKKIVVVFNLKNHCFLVRVSTKEEKCCYWTVLIDFIQLECN